MCQRALSEERCWHNTSTLHPRSTHCTHFHSSPQHLRCGVCLYRKSTSVFASRLLNPQCHTDCLLVRGSRKRALSHGSGALSDCGACAGGGVHRTISCSRSFHVLQLWIAATVVIAAAASASHVGPDAVSRSHAAGTVTSAAAHGTDAADAAADATDAASGAASA